MSETITKNASSPVGTTEVSSHPDILLVEEKEIKKSDPSGQAEEKKLEDDQLSEWQAKLLPLMTWMIVGLTLFFFIASFVQLAYLNRSIRQIPKMDILVSFDGIKIDDSLSADQMVNIARLKAQTILEANATEQLYHQANVLLLSRVWVRYMGFVTGMVLALVGSSFILGKLREPVSVIETKTSITSLALRSTSPGLILAALGVILMLTTISVNHTITVNDRPLYFQESIISTATSQESASRPLVEPISPNSSQDNIQSDQSAP